jgi:signal peptidase I
LASRLWGNWIKPIGMAVLVVCTFRSAVADWNDVPSQSMEPTILVGDRIFVNKLAYDLKVPFTSWRLAHWSGPQRGDIVVFFSPTDGKRLVKRVVGLPGDEIVLRDNHLYINGQPLSYASANGLAIDKHDLTDPEPWAFAIETLGQDQHPVMVQPARPAKRSFGPVQVPDGQYFVMGDNRDNSGDSRFFGFVPRDQIMGKAVGLAFSLDTRDGYIPRWNRFFRGLE